MSVSSYRNHKVNDHYRRPYDTVCVYFVSQFPFLYRCSRNFIPIDNYLKGLTYSKTDISPVQKLFPP